MSPDPTPALEVSAQSNDPVQQVLVQGGTDVRIVGVATNRGAEESRVGLQVDGRRLRVALQAGTAQDTFRAICRMLPRGYRADVVSNPGADLVVFQIRRASAEARTVAPPSARTARVQFERGFRQTMVGEVAPGGQLTIEYDPARALIDHALNGFPAWGVQAFVRVQPGGRVIEAPVLAFQSSFGRPAKRPVSKPITVAIPEDATQIQVWFRNWTGADSPREVWDSNFGKNYTFEVAR
ncbi:MAG: hypothetical protein HY901_22240 [Deltaproteobacteria bacterium]|nr:hypothetical protein [Deltaproteobacteria bacterium]